MVRIAVAFGVAIVGGALAGFLDWFLGGFVPSDSTRWAFYAIFGIPLYLILSVIFEPIGMLMTPDNVRQWPRLMRIIFGTAVWCVFLFTAIAISVNLKL